MGEIRDFRPKPRADDEPPPARSIGQILEMDLEAIVGPITAARYREYVKNKRSKD